MIQAGRLPEAVDVVIVGGGMVGLSLAAILAACDQTLSVALIEVMPLGDLSADTVPSAALPSSFDARSTALSESTRQIYTQVGLWQKLSPFACPIRSIHVSDRGKPGATRMLAEDCAVEGLGYVIENRMLGRILLSAVTDMGNVSIHSPLQVDKLQPLAAGMDIQAAGQTCTAQLVVAADGANSALLQTMGIHTDIIDYGQTALIANIGLDRNHQGIAYERFTDEGPVALLPLPDTEEEHRAALVWTLTPHCAEHLLSVSDALFLEELHRRFGFRAGRFRRCGHRVSYPLRLLVAEEQVRRHLVVAGNAAHFLHPVAGQGFNLALRDMAKLSESVLDARRAGRGPGNLKTLEAYIESQSKDQRNTIGFSHSLPALFGNQSLASTLTRNSGLIALDLIPPLRRGFASFGAGLLNPGMKLARYEAGKSPLK